MADKTMTEFSVYLRAMEHGYTGSFDDWLSDQAKNAVALQMINDHCDAVREYLDKHSLIPRANG